MAPSEMAAWQSSLLPQIMATRRPPGLRTRLASATASPIVSAYWKELKPVTIS